MRIAVTGAAGSLGGRVVRLLAGPDADVVAMTRRKPPAEAFPPGVEVAVADYGDPAALRAALKGVDTLVFVSGDRARCTGAAAPPQCGRRRGR
ncbi:NAD(P)H-binding protein [Streptomyces lichenis]|uniref:NAD(P)H-binding protein n=1 Tax=Streptomyces lichenis TaxID=2306967 RepID=A0ABT0IGW3_9ACTN|nr:NAD(P)H-binding protein [Streptomyces lichenis]MCK8680536.1 NAD(P)H-binding protein [Streptomyces lichenis]